MGTFNHKKLTFYQTISLLVKLVYNLTHKFPHDEQGYTGLVSQLRRAIVGAKSNIAEGSSRKNREFAHYLSLSLGSLREVESHLEIAFDLNYITEIEFTQAKDLIDKSSGRLYKYRENIEKKSKLENREIK